MKINNNIQALNAYRNLTANQFSTSKNLERLSSGLRINRAADDAAGLAISEKMRSQIRGLQMAERNALDAVSLIQTAEGALNESHAILQRMRELSVQAANDTNTDDDRREIQNEINQLKDELNRIGRETEFNTQKLIDGSQGVKRTSAELTGGVKVDFVQPVVITDNVETRNNSFVLTLDNGANTINLSVSVPEGSFKNPVELTVAVENAIQQAARDFDSANGVPTAAPAVAGLKLNFQVDTNETSTTYEQVRYSFTNSNTTFDMRFDGATNAENDILNKFLGFGSPTVVAKQSGPDPVVVSAASFSLDNNNNPNRFNDFLVKLEDGINPGANQNNELKMAIDGLNVTGYIAEGNYDNPSNLANAAYSAILGLDITNPAWSAFAANPTSAQWIGLVSASSDGLISSVDTLSDDQLKAKGYNGQTDDMKAAYFKDLVGLNADGTTQFKVEFNTDGKLEIFGPAEMKFDESSQVANSLGMTRVNVDIKNAGLSMQIGSNSNQTLVIDIGDMRATALGATEINGSILFVNDLDITSSEGAQNALRVLDNAIQQVSSERSKLGAFQNRLEHTINNLQVTRENLTSSESRIRDADMALEMTNFTKNNILNQAGTAMLAQANQLPQGVLQLLQ